jgi:Bacterial Ig-like domain (group 3)/Beta-propeller repeat
MKRAYSICLFQCLTATLLLSQTNPASLINPSAKIVPLIGASPADAKAQTRILDSYGKLPLSFEANHGQTDARVRFLSRTGGYSLFLTGDEAVFAMAGKNTSKNRLNVAGSGHALRSKTSEPKAGRVLRMKLRNANPAAKVTGVDELAGTSNYFIGNDPAKWRTSVPAYAKVKYEGIYSGIDLVYYGNQRQLEYDFIVAPGADPHRIAFDVDAAERIRQNARGDLVFKVGEDEIRWHKPVVYQKKDGEQELVAARYAITGGNRVGFELAKYDASRPLYIDPMIYSTYLGGSGFDSAAAIAVDSGGNAYVTGWTTSINFPTKNPLQSSHVAFETVFVAKINGAGSALVYSTYLGGSENDAGRGISVDSAGNAYVTGSTASPDFPTMHALQPAYGGSGDSFVAEINSAGSALVYSTYLGGSGNETGYAIVADNEGNAYVAGSTQSTDFPATPGAFQTNCAGTCVGYGDAFVTKIGPAGSAFVYSTYLGGSAFDVPSGIAVDNAGNAYLTGETDSTDFPTMSPLQAFNAGSVDAFVTKLNPTGSALLYSTYLGGNDRDYGQGIAVDGAGNAYVTGHATSADFPTTSSAFQTVCGGCSPANQTGDAFVAKINSTGSAFLYSTYLGGSGNEWGKGIAVDSAGAAYVTGFTSSTDFPTIKPQQGTLHGVANAILTKINPKGSGLLYSTYLGGSGQDGGQGIVVDSSSNAYVAGGTTSTNFPIKGYLQRTYGGGNSDAFVARNHIVERPKTTITLSSAPNPSTYGQAVTFTAVLTTGGGAPPDGETVTFKKGTTVLGTGSLSGGSASFTTSALPVGTNYIKAVYAGDSEFGGGTSNLLKQVVH